MTAIGVETIGIGKRFGSFQALSDVSMKVHPASVHGLLGENDVGLGGPMRPDDVAPGERAIALALGIPLEALVGESEPRPVDQALIVRFIDHASPPRVEQPAAQATPPRLVPPPQQTTARVRPVTHEKPHRDAMVLQDHEPAPAPATSAASPAAASVFAKDGSVQLAPTQTTYASTTAKAKPPPQQQQPGGYR